MTSVSPDPQVPTGQGSFSSGLSVSDFAACLDMGLEPLGLVQGFCVMRSQPTMSQMSLSMGMTPYQPAPNDYVENYHCPHGIVSAEHRMWGQNYQQTWIERIWRQGFSSAYTRMLSEATTLHAHGIVGVFDNVTPLVQDGIVEFRMFGTAVRLKDHQSTSPPWSTYLAGQRLAKSFEAGFAPVSIVAAVSSVRVSASCVTQYAVEGTGSLLYGQGNDSFEIEQLVSARAAARGLVRQSVKSQLHADQLHGVELLMREHDFGHGDFEIQPVLRGNRVRRFKNFAALLAPRPTVTLS
ncbi:MAG: hypothetical protein HIU84_06485 [Acidobacteria bacterium]|nr:hypothetical protein [Acidobacteriota bacterium]